MYSSYSSDPYNVQPENLGLLSPTQAISFLRELLWAEAFRIGAKISSINIPSNITAPDGGIDAEVDEIPTDTGSGVLLPGYTAYQVKTGDFKIGQDSKIEELLFDKQKSGRTLKPRVKECLDRNGNFVVVLFGSDDPDPQGYPATRIKERLCRDYPAYENAQIRVWRPNQLAGFLTPFPTLRKQLLGRDDETLTYRQWENELEGDGRFVLSEEHRALIEDVRKDLRMPGSSVHIRITGEPGIGKTRIVFEIMKAEDLFPLVLYTPSPDAATGGLISSITAPDSNETLILIVDECDVESATEIRRRIGRFASRIRLITIDTEPTRISGVKDWPVPPLTDEQLTQIISSYVPIIDQANKWVEYCGGSPRVAHVIGQNLKDNPEDLLRIPEKVDVWTRYLAYRRRLDDPVITKYVTILKWLSTFRKIGHGYPYHEEARFVKDKLATEGVCTSSEFDEAVLYFQKRKVLQGRATLYISPRLLHIWLWSQWWERFASGRPFSLDEFARISPLTATEAKYLSPELLDSFGEMFEYARSSQAAMRVVSQLLSCEGPFDFNTLNSSLGSSFFRRLAGADPPGAMNCLWRVLGGADREQLLTFTEGRRAVVWALERLASWKTLFGDAARILLALGEAETEIWGNNASGIFAGLFTPAPGPLAPTEATPEERYPILREALFSGSKERQRLGLTACKRALHTGDFVATVHDESPWAVPRPQPWVPQNYQELYDAYRRVWNLVLESLPLLSGEEKVEADRVLIDAAPSLSRIPDLASLVLESLRTLSTDTQFDRQELLKQAIMVSRYRSDLPKEVGQQWQALQAELVGSSFGSLLRRYVGMNLIEDDIITPEGKREQRDHFRLVELVTQAINDPSLLTNELEWLNTPAAKNGHIFGYELGKQDTGASLRPLLKAELLKAGEGGAAFLFGGYLSACRERDAEEWEQYMEALANEDGMLRWIPELTWRSGSLSEASAARLLRLAREGKFAIAEFGRFTLGGAIASLSEGGFRAWIEFLLSCDRQEGIGAAINLFQFYYARPAADRPMPEDLAFRLLTHPALFGGVESLQSDDMFEYEWGEIASNFISAYPDRGIALAQLLLESFGKDNTVLGSFGSRPRNLLWEIVTRYPREVWKLASSLLGPPIDERAYAVHRWLSGEFLGGAAGPISLIPPDALWEWVDANPKERAWYMAGMIPTALNRDTAEGSLARQLLVRYGDREEVRRHLAAHYSSGSWMGSMSEHLRAKKDLLVRYREQEDNLNVLRWIDEFVANLDRQIEVACAHEERMYV